MDEKKEIMSEDTQANESEKKYYFILGISFVFFLISLFLIYNTIINKYEFKIGDVYIKNKPDINFKDFNKVYIFLYLAEPNNSINTYLNKYAIQYLFTYTVNLKNGSTLFIIGKNGDCVWVDLPTAKTEELDSKKCIELAKKLKPSIIIKLNRKNKNEIIFKNKTMFILPKEDPESIKHTIIVGRDIMLNKFNLNE